MSKIKLDYICRLATVSDLDNILEVFHIYNDDEALAKAINMNMRGSSELNQSIIDLIDTGCVMVAINSDNSEVYGFSIFYEKSGLDPSTIKGSLLETVEEDAVKTCQELGLETLAPIVSVCNICMDVTSIWPEKFVYLEAIGVKPQYRSCRI
ncbi:uncharacterized protein LOC111710836 isoform X2 [Eurytemora carolleeae]|nr:uncharacterized protein LOC111710836 isoform X2 [Eurytemora carolleeae]|eukprot:XP_023340764.1 uncharacterized protein LOC111710836 isoform X2 [Eurytemora affinis]